MGNDMYPLRYKMYRNSLSLTPNRAALKIQRVWRKYITTKRSVENVRQRFSSWFRF